MEYEIKKVDYLNEIDLCDLNRLLQEVYPASFNKFSIVNLKWSYLDNPLGRVISYNAFYNGDLVAHYACIPYCMMIQGRKVKGLLDINTATHPQHRGKGLFVKLANATFEYAKDNGFEFIIGVANANSIHGYLKYLNFQFIDNLDVKFGIGKKIYSNVKEKLYSTYWDQELLNWRLKSPIYSKRGSFIYGKTNFLGISNVIGIKTIMGHFPKQMIDNIKVKCSINIIRPLNLYIGLGLNDTGFYFKIPSFIKRSPFNLIFRDLTGELPDINRNNIFFQLIDFDVA